jgi:hypothetical protein
LSSKIVKHAQLKIYAGAPHGLPSTLKDRLNADLLEFVKSVHQKTGVSKGEFTFGDSAVLADSRT